MHKAFLLSLFTTVAATSPVSSQSMSPMRGEIRSVADSFALRVHPRNPYKHRINVAVRVYDADFRPIDANVTPPVITLGAGGSRSVLVVVRFDGARKRRVRVCTESVPFSDKGFGIKAQVCGKFIAYRF
ncbi:hypothetical protein T8J41_13350 [Nitratireductor rhodophyticola]|uniref:hypothetical protein n=1 Tax=Nitratireductor rhodophyticola TaxID=2854036 RepID=UPI002AC9C4EC|nr:hypothetical protein [Nitratireductor rhodophyticola]WPZ13147.1 hypothetical protein T8J41_13350 [Nitratireductor rhodophyticola]